MKKSALISLVSCLNFCCQDSSAPAKGFLEIYLTLNKVSEMQPSYQTAIWLEKEQGGTITTLYVSDYLSYGGYHDSTICPTWSKQSQWASMPEEVFDLVTAATPPIGEKFFRFSCQEHHIPTGVYHFHVQTHLVEKYNIGYEGIIKIGGKQLENVGQASYIPSKHPNATQDALSHVKARYVRP